ncbi:MAG: hypothetical protein Kow00105_10550 [Phycisphaeraceae bacterium]
MFVRECDHFIRASFIGLNGSAVAFVLLLWQACSTFGITPQNVLVLYNSASQDSADIANYYAQAHPGVNLLGLNGVSSAEEIGQDHYLNVIRPQVLAGLTEEIDVIVTTKDLPLRIRNDSPNPLNYPGWRGAPFGVQLLDDWWEPYSSLESELTRIDMINSADMMGDQAAFMSPPSFPYPTHHHASNPYFKSDQPFDHSNPAVEGMRLATRLDAFSVDDVKDMIDRAQAVAHIPSQQIVVLDDDPDAPATTVDRMAALGFNVLEPADQLMVYDNTNAVITDTPFPVIGYVGHGSHGSGPGYMGDFEFDIANGAVFHTWESFNAYSFQSGNNKYGQGLVGEWIELGGTAALGHVEEPTASTATVANEDVLWQALLSGMTLAEAAWSATPQLSFVNTVVGDPLMRLVPWMPGDADLDGQVGIHDLAIVLNNWNARASGIEEGDFDSNGFIGVGDLNIVLSNWSVISPPPVNLPEPFGLWWLAIMSWAARRPRLRTLRS